MRIDEPRIAPLTDREMDRETLDRFAGGQVLNIFRTLAHHPKLLKRWLVFGNHILSKNELSERDRELLILRTGWVCKAEYEWTQHVAIGLAAGLTQKEVDRIAEGPDADGLEAFDRVLLRAVDELCGNSFIEDDTWVSLAQRYDTRQIMDLIFTVGQYQLVSMALNSLGVQLEKAGDRLAEGKRP